MNKLRSWGLSLIGLLGLVLSAGFMSSCNKKDDPKLTTSGGGASVQSVVTVKGAAQ